MTQDATGPNGSHRRRALAAAVILATAAACRETPSERPRDLDLDPAELRLVGGMADTLFARGLTVAVEGPALHAAAAVELVVDAGTPNERRVAEPLRGNEEIRRVLSASTYDAGRLVAWRADIPDTLENGPHRLEVRVRDSSGVVRTLARDFVTHVADVPYTLALLPGLGGRFTEPYDIDARGTVVGSADDSAHVSRAVVWRAGAVARFPEPSGTRSSSAMALNASGDVVGVMAADERPTCPQAVRWRGDAPPETLLAGCGSALDVNALGEVLIADRLGPISLWRNGLLTDTGLRHLSSVSLNDRSQVVGRAFSTITGYDAPHFWNVQLQLPVRIGCWGRGHSLGALVAINARSQAIGLTRDSCVTTSYLTEPGRPPVDLAAAFGAIATGYPAVEPVDITDAGTVLAFDTRSATVLLWRDGRTSRVRLATSGWRVARVRRMNEAGQIIGWVVNAATKQQGAVLLTPAR